MSHIPAKGMCAGRHITARWDWTQPNILTIIIAPLEEPAYDALRDIAQVTYMLKSPSIALISEDDEAVAEQVDDVFRLRTDPHLFSILAILPGQLLPYGAPWHRATSTRIPSAPISLAMPKCGTGCSRKTRTSGNPGHSLSGKMRCHAMSLLSDP